MPTVRARRGVCVGVEQHMHLNDTRELDPVLAKYLVSIGAVEIVHDEPAAPVESEPVPAKFAGKKEK